jgi:HEAT repeat protein
MRTTKSTRWSLLLRSLMVALVLAGSVGCHADENDAAGQAGELGDAVRRANAIANISRLYTTALAHANGDRTAEEPHHIADVTVAQLTQCFLDHSEDHTGRRDIITLLGEMRDIRSLPALIEALHWQPEVSEEPAISAARTIAQLELDDAQKGQVITALDAALAQIRQARGVDNRMRIEFLRALGSIGDRRGTAALSRTMLLQSENQDFLINRLACEQLGHVADPASIPALIQALYLFGPNNPAMRMNDMASMALVRIGRPAMQPLLDTMAGNNAEANQIATQYIAAVRQRDEQAAAQMSVGSIVVGEASFALGQLGFRDAIDPLIAETNQIDPGESPTSIEEDASDESHMASAALALVSINRDESDSQRIREALINVYNRLNPEARPGHASRAQLLVAFQHLNDPGLLPFLLQKAQPAARGQEDDPNIRILAFRAYALMADASEIANLERILSTEPEGDSRDGFLDVVGDLAAGSTADSSRPVFAAAHECNQDVSCWANKLTDSNTWVVRKACYMLARFGRGNDAAVTALVGQLGNSDEEIRGEVLYALDFVATHGSAAAVARIDELHDAEQGRSIWSHTESLFLSVQARLAARATAQ